MLSVQGNAEIPWESRDERAFFRGRDSHKSRLELARMAKRHPHLIDAGITKYFFFKEFEKKLGITPQTSVFDFFKAKYQVMKLELH